MAILNRWVTVEVETAHAPATVDCGELCCLFFKVLVHDARDGDEEARTSIFDERLVKFLDFWDYDVEIRHRFRAIYVRWERSQRLARARQPQEERMSAPTNEAQRMVEILAQIEQLSPAGKAYVSMLLTQSNSVAAPAKRVYRHRNTKPPVVMRRSLLQKSQEQADEQPKKRGGWHLTPEQRARISAGRAAAKAKRLAEQQLEPAERRHSVDPGFAGTPPITE